MAKRRLRWLVPLGLALICGCAGEDTSSSPSVSTTGKPALNKDAGPTPGKAPAQTPAVPSKSEPSATSSAKDDGKKGDAPALEGPKTDASSAEGKTVKFTDKEMTKIKTLPADEQEAALKQQVCPVSGENLGSMGTPYKVTALSRTFFLCCKSCQDELKADPKAVLAKLDKK
jgi:hypothetical protein